MKWHPHCVYNWSQSTIQQFQVLPSTIVWVKFWCVMKCKPQTTNDNEGKVILSFLADLIIFFFGLLLSFMLLFTTHNNTFRLLSFAIDMFSYNYTHTFILLHIKQMIKCHMLQWISFALQCWLFNFPLVNIRKQRIFHLLPIGLCLANILSYHRSFDACQH